MVHGDPRTDRSYISMSLDALSGAQTSPAAAGRFTGQIQFSVDAWVRFNGLSASTVVLGQNNVFSFGSQGPLVYFQFADLPAVISDVSQSQLQDDHWHYICATFDGSMIRLYIDGQFNTGQSCMGQVTPSGDPVLIGQGVQGLVKRVRIYNTVLNTDTVLHTMYGTPPAGTLVADFDFSVNRPVDRGPSSYPISLQNNAIMVKVSPAVSLGTNGFIRPLGDVDINPGGRQVDPYSVQAWVYLSSDINPVQAIFVNSDLMLDTGMALYVQYDEAISAYRLASQRGSVSMSGQTLTSSGIVPPCTWTNVATTFDGVNLTLYINGTLDSSITCVPIPLYNPFGDLLIGAAIEKGNPSGTTTLQGYIREVDVWSRTLSTAEVAGFMATPPDAGAPGLLGAYVFTSSPARNQANGHPIGLAEGAVLSGQLEVAPVSTEILPCDTIAVPETGLDPEMMADIRAGLNFREIYEENRAAFDAAEAADIAAFNDPTDKERIRKAWTDVRNKIANDPASLPFLVTHHKINGERLLIVHRPSGSYVAYRTAEENFDDCTMWQITLVFIVIGGVLDATTGVGATMTDKAIAFIARILKVPKIMAILALGTAIGASNIFALMGILYSEGVLRQLIVLVLDIGFWALIRIIGNIFAIVTGFASVRIIASLVATAITFGITYSSKPKSCDPLPTVSLASVAFDYDPTGASTEALTIRCNYKSVISVPEWVPGKTKPDKAPCAYALNALSGKIPTIQVVINISKATTQSIRIQATGGGILGTIDPIAINFGSNTSATVTLSLPHNTLAAGGVQRAEVTWTWQFQVDGGAWTTMVSTSHVVYVLLDKPNTPWIQVPDRTNQQLPWTDVLDHVCVWAAGSKSTDDILAKVTLEVNSKHDLIYDVKSGRSFYVEYPKIQGDLQYFLCGQFIEYLKDKTKGNGNTVNCTDCATIVTSFANILGCDIMESIMSGSPRGDMGFKCNEIRAIGTKTWAVPFKKSGGGGFSYHEITWSRNGCMTDTLYDACLEYDTGSNPWGTGPHTAGLPVNVQFSKLPPMPSPFPVSVQDALYRERLATNTVEGIPQCLPRGPWAFTNSGRRPVK